MGSYRKSRNLEASVIDYLTTNLASSWSNVNVEKSFARVYDLDLPVVLVRLTDTIHSKGEIGTTNTLREPQILIDIFATSDGQRLDLKDYLITLLKGTIDYYEYVIESGNVSTKTQNGVVQVMYIEDTPVNFNIDLKDLERADRYRHLITIYLQFPDLEE